MPGRGLALSLALLVALAVIGGACDENGGAGGESTASPGPTAMETEVADTPVAGDIRQEDLTAQPGLAQLLDSGGEVVPDSITYVDLSEDGIEDAVVPVSSGGEGGNIALFVYGYGPSGIDEFLRVDPASGSIKENIVGGTLTTTEPVYQPDDPLCCPSELLTTTYRWDGSQLVIDERETVPAVEN
jgi:hypothetical protein